MKKVYVHQNSDGCIESFLDFKNARKVLLEDDWEITDRPEEAEMLLVNTCVVGKYVEDHCLGEIQALQAKKRDDAELVVTGCMPEYAPQRLAKAGVDFSFGPQNFASFRRRYGLRPPKKEAHTLEPDHLGPYNLFNWGGRLLSKAEALGLPLPSYLYRRFALVEDSNMEFLRISRGCLENCTYCATRFATGRLVSEPMEKILARVDDLLASGRRSIVLCGEDSGAWGRDIGYTFADLLEKLLSRPHPDLVLSIRQHQPNWAMKELPRYLELLSDKRVKSIMLPIQSGSDRILKLMGRRYTAAQAEDMIHRIHEAAPQAMLRTHVIVGFPTETWEEYLMTERLIRRTSWDMVLVFPYTDRPRTGAARIKQKVPTKEIVKRTARLNAWVLWDVYLNRGNPFPIVRKNPMS